MSEWRTWWEELASEYAKQFQVKPIETIGAIANSEVALQCMKYLYGCFVREAELVAIENLESDVKRKLFEEAKEISVDQSKEHIINVCRAIYLLGVLAN